MKVKELIKVLEGLDNNDNVVLLLESDMYGYGGIDVKIKDKDGKDFYIDSVDGDE